MAELINTNVFDANKKFVDFAGLDYFWEKAKAYVDGVDTALTARVKANEDAISSIQDELNSLSGGAGSIATQINNAITALDLPGTYEAKGEAAKAQAAAEAYADGLASNYEVAGEAAKAEAAAKAYVDGLASNYDEAGAAAQALVDAKSYADGKFQVAGNYEAEGAAAQALVDAKAYVDGKVDGKFDAAGSASAAQAAAIAQAKADAAETLKGYYTKTEVDNLLATNTAADQAYAKQYTDELFGSFKFAQNSDIDALFA